MAAGIDPLLSRTRCGRDPKPPWLRDICRLQSGRPKVTSEEPHPRRSTSMLGSHENVNAIVRGDSPGVADRPKLVSGAVWSTTPARPERSRGIAGARRRIRPDPPIRGVEARDAAAGA